MTVVLYGTGSTLQTVGVGCGPEVIGIAFTLITVRIGLGLGQDSGTMVSGGEVPVRSPRRTQIQFGENASPMRTFTLNVTQSVEQEIDYGHTQSEMKPPEPAVLDPATKRSAW